MGGWGVVGGGGVDGVGSGWGCPHTCAHSCTHTHAHACMVNIISCKWQPPLGNPGNSL